MIVLKKNLCRPQSTDLSISIIASSPAMPFDVSQTGQLGTEQSSMHVTPIARRASPNGAKPLEGSRGACKRERDMEDDAYGENGERMPYLRSAGPGLLSGSS